MTRKSGRQIRLPARYRQEESPKKGDRITSRERAVLASPSSCKTAVTLPPFCLAIVLNLFFPPNFVTKCFTQSHRKNNEVGAEIVSPPPTKKSKKNAKNNQTILGTDMRCKNKSSGKKKRKRGSTRGSRRIIPKLDVSSKGKERVPGDTPYDDCAKTIGGRKIGQSSGYLKALIAAEPLNGRTKEERNEASLIPSLLA